jgi:hypothetical protein
MMAQGVARQLEQVIDLREEGVIQEDAIVDIPYQQLVSDPQGALEAAYEGLHLRLGAKLASGLRAFLKSKAGASRDSHLYPDLPAERVARDRPVFSRYQAKYGVPDEV